MPKNVQIRNVPDELHRSLKVQAAEAGLSLSEFLLRELDRVAARPTMRELAERAARRTSGPSVATIVEVIREGRQERDVRWS